MFKKGFTLIELLVTIAIIAVIAAAVLVAIDPQDKIRAANDGRAQADIGQVATAVNTYTASNGGAYPVGANWAALGTVLAGELSVMPTQPTGYTYGGVGTATTAVVYSTLLSKKYQGLATSRCVFGGATPVAYWFWTNLTGGACGICKAGVAVPAAGDACAWNP